MILRINSDFLLRCMNRLVLAVKTNVIFVR
jgi:hypothetical protein